MASSERGVIPVRLERDSLGGFPTARSSDSMVRCDDSHNGGIGWARAHRWGRTAGKLGFHGGKVSVERPRVRACNDGAEMALPSWQTAQSEDWLGQWALSLMLINVSTRRFERAVRLPQGDIPAAPGAGLSKSAASRRFVALSAERMAQWMTADLSPRDLLAIQIDGMHVTSDLTLLAAVGIDGNGVKHPLGLMEGATENAAVVQALLDDLTGRGLDPKVCRLFIVDGSKALTKAIRNTFGRHTPIQRCQVHKARNILERLPKHLHAPVRAALRQAWELDDADKAERLIRNLTRRLEQVGPGVAASILEGMNEMLTVIRLGPASAAGPPARLHQHHREHAGHDPPRLPQRQTLAGCIDGIALDRGGGAGSRQVLPATESVQAASAAACCSCRASGQAWPNAGS